VADYTPDNGPISLPPNHTVEAAFVAYLKADATLTATGIDIVAASDRSVTVNTPYIFVSCQRATPVLTFGQNYKCDVQVVLATNIDDVPHSTRVEYLNKLLAAVTRQEGMYSAKPTTTLIAWPIQGQQETSDQQETGDVILLTVAACVAG
jgi:hypothetical protein